MIGVVRRPRRRGPGAALAVALAAAVPPHSVLIFVVEVVEAR
jgi:hypothetical protein